MERVLRFQRSHEQQPQRKWALNITSGTILENGRKKKEKKHPKKTTKFSEPVTPHMFRRYFLQDLIL